MEREFTGRVAVVTGAAQGIGRASSKCLARGGARVWLLDRDTVAGNELVSDIHGEGGDAEFIETELGDALSVTAAFDQILRTDEGIDLLHNNAGIQRYGTVVETTEEMWDEVFRVNVKSAYLVCHHAVPLMQTRGGGSIVLTSSVQAYATQSRVVAYAGSKGALTTMTMAMALDHAKERIRVNAVAPGSVDTPMLQSSAELFQPSDPQSLLDRWGSGHPVGRLATPDEVAEVVMFLLSDRASFVTGTTVRVDGGLLSQIGVPLP